MGRNAKPIELHLVNGNKRHLTKAEIEQRKKAEVKFGDSKLVCPSFVKALPAAAKKWREMVKLYQGFDFVRSGDVGMLARYCVAYAEYLDLVEHRQRIREIKIDGMDESLLTAVLPEVYSRQRAVKTFEKIDYILSVAGLLALDKAINAKMDALVKMEDRLFLNPVAKIKNVPKTPEKKVDAAAEMGFDV